MCYYCLSNNRKRLLYNIKYNNILICAYILRTRMLYIIIIVGVLTLTTESRTVNCVVCIFRTGSYILYNIMIYNTIIRLSILWGPQYCSSLVQCAWNTQSLFPGTQSDSVESAQRHSENITKNFIKPLSSCVFEYFLKESQVNNTFTAFLCV